MKAFFQTRALLALFLLIALPFFAGCSNTGATGSPGSILQNHEAQMRAGVKIGTLLALKKHPERAPRVAEVATFIEENAGSVSALSVAALEMAVRRQINFDKFDPVEAALWEELIVNVRDGLVSAVGVPIDAQLPPDAVLTVKKVAGWIRDAATAAQG